MSNIGLFKQKRKWSMSDLGLNIGLCIAVDNCNNSAILLLDFFFITNTWEEELITNSMARIGK